MPTETLNVVIYPPKEVREYAIGLSESLKQCGGFVLDDVSFFPHITLYLAEYPHGAIDEIRKVLPDVVSSLKTVLLEPKDYSIESGYIAVGYEKTKEIETMQINIISACNHFRKGSLRLRDIEKMESYDLAQRKNIDVYGFRSVGESYHPHLTLTKSKGTIPASLPPYDRDKLKFTSGTIALMRVGEFGTGRELIEEYSI